MANIICGIFFIITGISALLRPDVIWKLTKQWKSASASGPTGLYLLSIKLGGSISILIGVAAVTLPFIWE